MSQQEHMEQGTVEAVNDRGVKMGGAWWNFSKFSEVAHPQVGQEVQLLIRGDKWVQACKVVGADAQVDEGDPFDDAPPFAGGGNGDDPSSWGYGTPGRGTAAPRRVAPAAPAPAPKSGRATLRAAALAASAHFHSAHEVDEAVVYDTASCFLAWIEGED